MFQEIIIIPSLKNLRTLFFKIVFAVSKNSSFFENFKEVLPKFKKGKKFRKKNVMQLPLLLQTRPNTIPVQIASSPPPRQNKKNRNLEKKNLNTGLIKLKNLRYVRKIIYQNRQLLGILKIMTISRQIKEF